MNIILKSKYLKILIPVLTIAAAGLFIYSNHHKIICQEKEKNQSEFNRLKNEKSPYLLQHADNPVNWFPWGDEAFEKAKKENKPIFLSIGYSTCHWCHVMEKESFEDTAVARLMNETFISIKVDREERPDIDNIYMAVCQEITGSGGWPLTIIMTPDKKPFFAGTYIPRDSRLGVTGLTDLIPEVKQAWMKQRPELEKNADNIVDFLKHNTNKSDGEDLKEYTLEFAFGKLSNSYDKENGGFGFKPKFPMPDNLLFLLRYWNRTKDNRALEMVEKTLNSMRMGGIYDQIGYGFHRYSTDPNWKVPHFEKMLYDQAMIVMAYTELYQVTKNEAYKQTAEEILTYVLRDMTSPEGGFYSAEDADSDGEEGKFYLWTEQQIRKILDNKEADVFLKVFVLNKISGQEKNNGNNLLQIKSYSEASSELKISATELKQSIDNSKQKIFEFRQSRVRPFKDDKILTDWNGLMIVALSKAARVFDEPKYNTAAVRAMDFILKNLMQNDNRLIHRYRNGEAAIKGNIDDYAFTVWALIELYETSFNVNYLKTAFDINKELLSHFSDNNGGFYYSADDGETLITRQKEYYDGVIPSGNSVEMLNLIRLGRISMNSDYEKKAVEIARSNSIEIKSNPQGYTMLLCALDYAFGPSYEVVISGNSQASDTKEMILTINRSYIPNKILILRPNEIESPEITQFAEFTKELVSKDNKPTAFVCRNYACSLPTTDINQMMNLFKNKFEIKHDK